MDGIWIIFIGWGRVMGFIMVGVGCWGEFVRFVVDLCYLGY